ncbi:MAG: UMP kinase [Nanobdellota archaeon]
MYVISVGGSLVVPDGVDVKFLLRLRDIVLSCDECFVLICGGGRLAREYQSYGRHLGCQDEDLDWVGIRATQLNAELVRSMFGEHAYHSVVADFTGSLDQSKVFVGAGSTPGCSTDLRAVQAAGLFDGSIINLSNIDYVYDGDPRTSPDARGLKRLSWAEYRALISDSWTPGMNVPFDPVAARQAQEQGSTVLFIDSLDKLQEVVEGKKVEGTYII